MYHEKIQQTKLITTYGAVGSLIETLHNGTLKILEFDRWPYYSYLLNTYVNSGISIPQNLVINEERLLYRIRTEKNLVNLQGLFRLPENKMGYDNQLVEPQNVIAGDMFPKWYLCPSCRTDNLRHESQLIPAFQPRYPRCPVHPYILLEQFPFILVSESGRICDIPWIRFIQAAADANVIDFNPADASLYRDIFTYSSGGSAELLNTKTIRIGGGDSKSLARLGSICFRWGTEEFKVVSRHGNNVCFIEKLSSVSVPSDFDLPANVRVSLNTIFNTMKDISPVVTTDQVFQSFVRQHPGTGVIIEQVIHHFAVKNENRWDEETKFRSEEYRFFLNHERYDSADSRFRKIRPESPLFSSHAIVDRLKIVHVQSSYSRLDPAAAKNAIYINNGVKLYPAIEMYGEGIFLFFDLVKLNEYRRINNIPASEMLSVIHTFVHSLIRELEFHTGYSVNSMNERLYFCSDEQDEIVEAGALVYSASTAEGSYGGMATLFVEDANGRVRFSDVVEQVFVKARECPNDPVCITETLSNGSKGVCYSCNLLPEITCEKFNQELNRGRMIAYLDYVSPPIA